MEKIIAYKCSFCKDSSRRLFLSKSGCRKHEKKCWLNPVRKSCATCANLCEKIETKEPYGAMWRCFIRKSFTPFSKKVSDCAYWEESGAIFTNEDILLNRPIERQKSVQ